MRGQLHKTYLNKNKNSFLESEFNYFFYNEFFKNLKFLNKKTIFKIFIKNTNRNTLIFSPNYMFKSQFFSNKSVFNDLLINFKLKGFFLYNNFFKNTEYRFDKNIFKSHIIGYNYYIFNKTSDNINTTKIINITDDKDYNGVGKIKFILTNQKQFNFNKEFNSFFNFNLYCINVLEIYKIFIFLYFSKI